MRTYISWKYYYILSWISLVTAIIFIIAGLFFFIFLVLFTAEVNALPFLAVLVGLSQYRLITARSIYIEGDKIVAKGIFKMDIFLISEFKEVKVDWWGLGNNFVIYFENGKNFTFYPPVARGFLFSNQITAEKINEKIRGMSR